MNDEELDRLKKVGEKMLDDLPHEVKEHMIEVDKMTESISDLTGNTTLLLKQLINESSEQRSLAACIVSGMLTSACNDYDDTYNFINEVKKQIAEFEGVVNKND